MKDQHRFSGRRHRRCGLSIIEVLTSIFVVSIGLLGVLGVIPYALFQLRKANEAEHGGNCARAAVQEIQVRWPQGSDAILGRLVGGDQDYYNANNSGEPTAAAPGNYANSRRVVVTGTPTTIDCRFPIVIDPLTVNADPDNSGRHVFGELARNNINSPPRLLYPNNAPDGTNLPWYEHNPFRYRENEAGGTEQFVAFRVGIDPAASGIPNNRVYNQKRFFWQEDLVYATGKETRSEFVTNLGNSSDPDKFTPSSVGTYSWFFMLTPYVSATSSSPLDAVPLAEIDHFIVDVLVCYKRTPGDAESERVFFDVCGQFPTSSPALPGGKFVVIGATSQTTNGGQLTLVTDDSAAARPLERQSFDTRDTHYLFLAGPTATATSLPSQTIGRWYRIVYKFEGTAIELTGLANENRPNAACTFVLSSTDSLPLCESERQAGTYPGFHNHWTTNNPVLQAVLIGGVIYHKQFQYNIR